jgi:hypothetical protein
VITEHKRRRENVVKGTFEENKNIEKIKAKILEEERKDSAPEINASTSK